MANSDPVSSGGGISGNTTGPATSNNNSTAPPVSAEEYNIFSKTQRLGLAPELRIALAITCTGGYGLLAGFYSGFRKGSLQFLAENAHRLPKTKGGWYFYHKRKNYVVIKSGLADGSKAMIRLASLSGLLFGVEAYIDHIRGVIDFGSTVASATVVGISHGLISEYKPAKAI